MCNQFSERHSDIVTLDTKISMHKEVLSTINTIEEIRKSQYSNFVRELLQNTETQ